LSHLYIPVDPPYFKKPKPELSEFGLPVKEYYTTGEVCKILGLKPDAFRARVRSGYYPEPNRIGQLRRFTLDEIKMIARDY